jgi:hypothetical protein
MNQLGEKELPSLITRFKYRIRNNDFFYRNILNYRFRIKNFEIKNNYDLDQIVDSLRKDGIVVSSLNKIFGTKLGMELLDSSERWIKLNEKNLKPNSVKKYLYSYLEQNIEIDLSNPIVQFYISPQLSYIATKYLGYAPQLNEITIEKTVPVGDSNPIQSQNWHRDPQEKRTLKIFLYLNNVTMDSGPFIYIKQSSPTSKGKYSKIAPQILPKGSYPDPTLIENTVEKKDIFEAIGSKGTVIICDTAGIHKGGLARSNERIMSTGFYPSKFFTKGRNYKLESLDLANIEKFSPLVKELLK